MRGCGPGLRNRDLIDEFGDGGLVSVWMESDGGQYPAMLAGTQAPPPLFPASLCGSNQPDDVLAECGPGTIHGKRLVDVGSQTPVPITVGGGTPFGPTVKAPATMGVGSDCVGQVLRQQRYPAIRNIHPESTGTIGSVARQSYQYVREQMPDKRPRNAWGAQNPDGSPIRQIDATIPPALEPPRYNYVGLDTDYIQQQHDILVAKQLLAERGMG